MALENRLDLRLTQKLILTPQLQLAIKLLQLTQLELSQLLTQELTENPFLEELEEEAEAQGITTIQEEEAKGDSSESDFESPLENLFIFNVDEYFSERSNDGRDLGYFNPGLEETPSFELFKHKKTSLQEHLLWQLMLSSASEDIRKVAEFLIGNIDEDGYLKLSEEEIIQHTGADRDIINKALAVIQDFDPTGVGARDLKECLLIQIKALNLQGSIVEKIIMDNLEDLCRKRYAQIAKLYGLTHEELNNALKIIRGLEPRPGRSFSSDEVIYIVPDVYIFKVEGTYQIVLNDDGLPKMRLNNQYRKLLTQKSSLSKEERMFLKEKMRSAIELMKSLQQRNRTIYKVAESILNFQKDFFDRGIQYLKPLTLKDVAADIKMHESTISRVTSSKFLSCSHGIFSFKYFFSSSISSEDGQVSSTTVKDLIKKIVSEENPKNPLSDQAIADKLAEYNIKIARRTVAKYREALKIPQQSFRRKECF
ncbi:MAG: RNA polymerase factor sigma-54 [Thermodesulfovibrionales bacterium]|nr:RNA polymerase factor sigma-54 [Thermodesulfovibrionales bacterium]